MNLERSADLKLFKNIKELNKTIDSLFLSKNVNPQKGESLLLFIDEIQEAPEVIESLRYFYEDFPQYHIIATGTLLDFSLQTITRTPVGRVQFAELHPINFLEYLGALENKTALIHINKIPLPEHLTDPLLDFFHDFAIIGGMPEIVKEYLK